MNVECGLTGCGESGKLTIFNQLNVIHRGGFSIEEKKSMRRVLQDNVLQSIVALLKGAERLKIEIEPENQVLRAANKQHC